MSQVLAIMSDAQAECLYPDLINVRTLQLGGGNQSITTSHIH